MFAPVTARGIRIDIFNLSHRFSRRADQFGSDKRGDAVVIRSSASAVRRGCLTEMSNAFAAFYAGQKDEAECFVWLRSVRRIGVLVPLGRMRFRRIIVLAIGKAALPSDGI